MTEFDWKCVGVRKGSHLFEEDVRTYSSLVEEFNNVFSWSYKDLKGIAPKVVKHIIPVIPRVKPIRHKERGMNLQMKIL